MFSIPDASAGLDVLRPVQDLELRPLLPPLHWPRLSLQLVEHLLLTSLSPP